MRSAVKVTTSSTTKPKSAALKPQQSAAPPSNVSATADAEHAATRTVSNTTVGDGSGPTQPAAAILTVLKANPASTLPQLQSLLPTRSVDTIVAVASANKKPIKPVVPPKIKTSKK